MLPAFALRDALTLDLKAARLGSAAGLSGGHLFGTFSSAASTSSLTSSVASTHFTRYSCIAASVPSAISRCDLPVPLSPIKHSGRRFLAQSQEARVWIRAALTAGSASESNCRRDLSRGNPAALIRRSERRRARSSHSDSSGSARNPGGH